MKKLLVILFIPFLLEAQVGIGTATPSSKSILDLTSTSKGFLLPRVTTTQRIAINPAATDLGLQVFDTTTNSFWNWNGTSWLQTGTNIYNSDGTVGSNRNVTLTDKINFDSGTFYIDGVNNKVGIGTSSPGYPLDVKGILGVGSGTGRLTFNNDDVNSNITNGLGNFLFYTPLNTNYIFSINGVEKMILKDNGYLGIGTNTPSQNLHVQGSVRVTGALYDGSDSAGNSSQVLSTDGTQLIWKNSTAVRYAVTGVFPGTTSTSTIGAANAPTGAYITLPPGKWSIQASLLINFGDVSSVTGGAAWIRSTLSDSNTILNINDITGASLFSGLAVPPSSFGMCTGTIIINNTSGANKTYYLWRSFSSAYGSVNSNYTLLNFGRGVANEDQMIAYPMN